MVCFGQIIDNTVDIGLHIFGKLNVQVLVCGNMQRIGNAEMIPQNIVQCGIFVDPHDLLDRDNSHGLIRKCDEKVLRDKHILGRQLWQRGKLLLRLCEQFRAFAVQTELAARGREHRKQRIEQKQHDGQQ